jgi:hypothetical protein
MSAKADKNAIDRCPSHARAEARGSQRKIPQLAVNALLVLARLRIDFNPLALFDEQGHVDDSAGLERRRLSRAACGIALHARFACNDLHHHISGEVNRDGVAIVKRNRTIEPFVKKARFISELVLFNVNLVTCVRVHKHEGIALFPRVRHFAVFDVGQFNRFARLPRALDHAAVRQVADSAARKGLTFARLNKLVLHHVERHAVDLDFQALADVHRVRHGAGGSTPPAGAARNIPAQ